MNRETNADLRTLGAVITKKSKTTWTIERTVNAVCLATIAKGAERAFVGRVTLDGRDINTPVYKRLDDVVHACLAPHLGAERGERWSFPAPDANDWLYE